MERGESEPRDADPAESGVQPGASSTHSGLPPAPVRPADPAAPRLVTQFLLCQAGGL